MHYRREVTFKFLTADANRLSARGPENLVSAESERFEAPKTLNDGMWGGNTHREMSGEKHCRHP